MGEQEGGLVIVETKQFIKSFEQLPARIQEQARKKLDLFRVYPRHAGLRVHKLSGTMRTYNAFWVNFEYRIIYEIAGNYTALIDIGTHEIYE